MNFKENEFKEKLEGAHSFPGGYTFKFIVKSEDQKKVEELVDEAEIKIKTSSGNKYVSVTLEAKVKSSDEVIAVYKKAKKIEGLIAL
ncbi:MAG: DUF493 domain-containing protein [Cyclobacteriaceae bacterium]